MISCFDNDDDLSNKSFSRHDEIIDDDEFFETHLNYEKKNFKL